MKMEALFSVPPCLSWSGAGEEGWAEGQLEERGPSLTHHRDRSDLFILVKKRTKTTVHCIWLDP